MLDRAHDRKPHHFRPLATPLNVLFARFALLSAPLFCPARLAPDPLFFLPLTWFCPFGRQWRPCTGIDL
jgi:hypothetical protein